MTAAEVSPIIVTDYEVFTNDKNAIAFFMMRHSALDDNREKGPFLFAVQDDTTLVVGTEDHHAILPNVSADIIKKIKDRNVMLLVEFENRLPFRCTPCYLSPHSN